ncbi:ABC transporter substrate-binding protein [Pseudodesulfovibrio sp. F-1]|uniref:ABC transporter substrate-binding protein n=1 Tax=Pseudodesulfovibrio alkaliphilus TaxID=2661613 RepID=A0A7K1KKG5_9BACT|nr:ABC transporter substrate-binding protein [Pseudodesulfovibrio alkaliphilus]MUM76574.1 ABC transporter substrate-binding protein [Pseudodesulfovibrio alkaliphilus]
MGQTLRAVVFILLSAALMGCGSADESGLVQSGAPGVSADEIRLGSSLALTGHAGYLGTQTLRGAEAYIRHVNESGGIHGRKIRIVAYDDSYDPPRCLMNTQQLIISGDVFALFCYVGTPTTIKVLPLVEEAGIPLVGMFTGANALRQPFNPYLVNIRASYYQETEAAVRHLVEALGIDRIAVFYQYDAYGFDGLIGTELALKQYDLEPVARGSYIRGTLNVAEGMDKIRHSGAEAVVMVGTYDACARFISVALEAGFDPIFYNVSFVGAEELARRLGPEIQSEVIMSQVVPQPVAGPDGADDAASQYVRLLARYYPDDTPSFVGLEGFLNARIMVEGLKRAGRDLTREGLIAAIESLRNYELGPDLSITYGPDDRQGLEKVYFTRLERGRFVPLLDWQGLAGRREETQ